MREGGGFTSTFVVEHLVIHGGGDAGEEVPSTPGGVPSTPGGMPSTPAVVPGGSAVAVTTAVFILNCAPTKALKGKTSFEAGYGRKPSVSFLQTFGCIGHVRKTKPNLTKQRRSQTSPSWRIGAHPWCS